MRFLAPFSRLASVQLPACGTSNHRGSAGCADVATWVDSDGDGVGDLAGLTRRLDYLSGRHHLVADAFSQHPWFQQARRDRGSRYRDYYRWSDTRQEEPSEVALPGEHRNSPDPCRAVPKAGLLPKRGRKVPHTGSLRRCPLLIRGRQSAQARIAPPLAARVDVALEAP